MKAFLIKADKVLRSLPQCPVGLVEAEAEQPSWQQPSGFRTSDS